MGAILCCLRGPGDEAPGCCSCLPWPFLNNNHQDSVCMIVFTDLFAVRVLFGDIPVLLVELR
jgi:hypothetical protein